MNLLYYLNYFFYIAFNWNVRLALFTVRHEIRGEKKYGINTIRLNNLRKLSIKGNSLAHAEMYQGSNYHILENLFGYLQNAKANFHLIDYGCGKGRALIVAAHFGFTHLTGVEFAGELCDDAIQNINKVKSTLPGKYFEVLNIDATDYELPQTADVCFFFNPFDEVVMLAVVKKILGSLRSNPRTLHIVYMNPVHKEIFESAGFEEVYSYNKMYYAQACILKKSPEDFGAFED